MRVKKYRPPRMSGAAGLSSLVGDVLIVPSAGWLPRWADVINSGWLVVSHSLGWLKLLDGELPVTFGCLVVAEVVVDLGGHLVVTGVMLRMQRDRTVHVCEGRVPFRGGQVCERWRGGRIPCDRSGQARWLGSVGDGPLRLWGVGGGPGVCTAAPVGRVIGREIDGGGVVVDGVLVIATV